MALVLDIFADDTDYFQIEQGGEIIRIKIKHLKRKDRVKIVITGGPGESTPSDNWRLLRKKVVEKRW